MRGEGQWGLLAEAAGKMAKSSAKGRKTLENRVRVGRKKSSLLECKPRPLSQKDNSALHLLRLPTAGGAGVGAPQDAAARPSEAQGRYRACLGLRQWACKLQPGLILMLRFINIRFFYTQIVSAQGDRVGSSSCERARDAQRCPWPRNEGPGRVLRVASVFFLVYICPVVPRVGYLPRCGVGLGRK